MNERWNVQRCPCQNRLQRSRLTTKLCDEPSRCRLDSGLIGLHRVVDVLLATILDDLVREFGFMLQLNQTREHRIDFGRDSLQVLQRAVRRQFVEFFAEVRNGVHHIAGFVTLAVQAGEHVECAFVDDLFAYFFLAKTRQVFDAEERLQLATDTPTIVDSRVAFDFAGEAVDLAGCLRSREFLQNVASRFTVTLDERVDSLAKLLGCFLRPLGPLFFGPAFAFGRGEFVL